MADSGVTTDVSTRSRRARPRNPDGSFGQSEPQKKRKALGLDPQPKAAQITPGISKAIAQAHPDLPASIRLEAAQATAALSANAQTLTKAVIDKIGQSLRKSEGLRTIIDGGPRAAKYAMALVDGVYPEAPHAVRLQAAFGVMEMAGYRLESAHDDRDLSELSLEELNQRLNSTEHAIDRKLAIPGESTEVGNAAPLPPESPIIDSPAPSDQRQAID